MALALHLGVFLPFGCTDTPDKKETPQEASKPAEGEPLTVFLPMTPFSGEVCDGYRGIGVKQLGFVLDVAPGSPADEAGIKAGDYIENSEILGHNRYDIGHLLQLIVVSPEGKKRQILVRTGWICEQKVDNP